MSIRDKILKFSIAAEYYSQGDGNFRDVLQNRRTTRDVHVDTILKVHPM